MTAVTLTLTDSTGLSVALGTYEANLRTLAGLTPRDPEPGDRRAGYAAEFTRSVTVPIREFTIAIRTSWYARHPRPKGTARQRRLTVQRRMQRMRRERRWRVDYSLDTAEAVAGVLRAEALWDAWLAMVRRTRTGP